MSKFKPGDRIRPKISGGILSSSKVYTVGKVGPYGGGQYVMIEGRYEDGSEPVTGVSDDEFDLVESYVQPPPTTAEADPNGIPQNAPGAKVDAGKLRPRLVLGEFSRALTEVVRIGTFGAEKYSPRGWLSVPNGRERYAEAADRHQLKVNQGERFDTGPGGTGGMHKAQVIWNLLAELELELREDADGQRADPA